jgi:hypothetical protein
MPVDVADAGPPDAAPYPGEPDAAPRSDGGSQLPYWGATPAIRLDEFLTYFPGRAAWTSICRDGVNGAMGSAGRLAGRVASLSPCLVGPVSDPSHPRCRAFDEDGGGRTEVDFSLSHDATCADTPSGLAATHVGTRPANAHFIVECL